MDAPKLLQFDYYRRFGVEMEVNATDGKDHIPSDKMPEGIHHIGNVVAACLGGDYVEIKSWRQGHDHNWDKNNYWLVKPDGSCGMEVCSPISKGWHGIRRLCQVADALSEAKVKADHRCSLHVHVEVSDLTVEELGSVIAYWIKCEPVFMDAFGDIRKNNKYCQFVGLWDWFKPDTVISPEDLVRLMGNQKYLSVNTFHLSKGKRATMEFRIADSHFCLNSYLLKNWVKFVIHFVEMAKKMPWPSKYTSGNPWSSWCWLDPNDVFKVLGFDDSYQLSPGMGQVRNWLLARMVENLGRSNISILSLAGRRFAHTQVFDMARKYMGMQVRDAITPPDFNEAVYGKIYQV